MKLPSIPKAFTDVFGGYAAQVSSSQQGILAKLLPNPRDTSPPRTVDELLKFYGESPLLRMVAGRIASDISAQNWRVYASASSRKSDVRYARSVATRPTKARQREIKIARDAGDLREVQTHPILTMINNGNEYMLGPVMMKLTQLHLDLVGEAFWIMAPNMTGVPV